jgi:hypothetical protein
MKSPFLADLAYLILKPWEWLAVFVLRSVVLEIDEIAGRIYVK